MSGWAECALTGAHRREAPPLTCPNRLMAMADGDGDGDAPPPPPPAQPRPTAVPRPASPKPRPPEADDGQMRFFVPAFVLTWAAGYTALSALDLVGDGLGDSGGFLAAAFAAVLLLGMVVAAVWETTRDP
eukprot:EG_transcript_23279